jgi:BMFP domain-containing protein YqiC
MVLFPWKRIKELEIALSHTTRAKLMLERRVDWYEAEVKNEQGKSRNAAAQSAYEYGRLSDKAKDLQQMVVNEQMRNAELLRRIKALEARATKQDPKTGRFVSNKEVRQ